MTMITDGYIIRDMKGVAMRTLTYALFKKIPMIICPRLRLLAISLNLSAVLLRVSIISCGGGKEMATTIKRVIVRNITRT
ncbi:MAG: hypothetical protein JHC33_13265 [Ignisphaera sp.]|nr:hypothetical protein [Ignisphaera sp.]